MTKTIILIILAILPVMIICSYIYKKDLNKEPTKLLLKLFIHGMLSCFLVIFISDILTIIFPFLGKEIEQMSFFELFIYSFFSIGLVEEWCKWFMVYKIGYHSIEFDEIYDSIIYCVFVSLGFALLENLVYVLSSNDIYVGITRGLLSVPSHACDAIFMGYYITIAKIYAGRKNKKLERINLYKSIIIPSILHGIYDFCLFSKYVIFLIVFIIFVIIIYFVSLKKLKEIERVSFRK